MDDPLLVRVLYGLTDRHEQFQTLARGDAGLHAVLRQRYSLDEIHHEIRSAGGSGPSIEHTCDVQVVHQRQGPAFRLEAGDDFPCVHAGLDDLERHLPVNRLLLFGQKDNAHTTLSDFPEQLIRADPRARLFQGRLVAKPGGQRSSFEEDAWLPVSMQ